ncbi:putative TetR family transcriptional regulator [Actinacidiphila reveromycinica]|uniref:Putative TetR family transcriptional regulator n=1 Tax=Actinacidiphila reveromycinica TaxID=659352 RepID=A0A7U3VQM7_9ACTN|nr:TetR/AcrR family transcriptional regulator [Streptomyces sp. SN-593]BBA99972.1 putative TetR family transcriptional regulator [Streptomyces sp. SN-593]
MPTVREALLEAASTALAGRAWSEVRMVEVAAAAGVSRQTLYNEFRSKEGLARALVRREADGYLAGVDEALARAGRDGGDAGDRFAAAAGWTLDRARRSPLVRAALAGDGAPRPWLTPLPDLAGALRARTAASLAGAFPRLPAEDVAWACDTAIRLTVSYVLVPAPSDDEACARIARAGRSLLARRHR